MAKSFWRGSGGASDGRIDRAPRRQRRLERKRANDQRHLNHPKAWAYVVDFFVAILSAKCFRKVHVLAAGPAPTITEKTSSFSSFSSSSSFQLIFDFFKYLVHFILSISIKQ